MIDDSSKEEKLVSHAAAQRRYNRRKVDAGWRRVCFWVPKGAPEADLKKIAKDFLQQFYKD